MSNNSGGSNQYIPIIVADIGAAGVIIAAAINAVYNKPSTPSPSQSPVVSQSPSPSPSSSTTKEKNSLKGTFWYSASTTWAPFRLDPKPTDEPSAIGRAIEAAFPRLNLKYEKLPDNLSPGSPAAMDMLRDNRIAFALTSRKLDPDPEPEREGFKVIPVAKTFRVAAVHRDLELPLGRLTLQDLKDICDGRKNNWQQFGGDNKAIRVFSRKVQTKTKMDLKVGDECEAAKLDDYDKPAPTSLIEELSETKGGIYIAAAPLLVGQCKVKTIPITDGAGTTFEPFIGDFQTSVQECKANPIKVKVNIKALKAKNISEDLIDTLYIVVKQDNSNDQKVGEALANFLRSDDAKEPLEQTGYISISSEGH